jgi:hypothetical protein
VGQDARERAFGGQDARERADAPPDETTPARLSAGMQPLGGGPASVTQANDAASQGTSAAPLSGTYPGAGRGILAPFDRPPDPHSFGAGGSAGVPLRSFYLSDPVRSPQAGYTLAAGSRDAPAKDVPAIIDVPAISREPDIDVPAIRREPDIDVPAIRRDAPVKDVPFKMLNPFNFDRYWDDMLGRFLWDKLLYDSGPTRLLWTPDDDKMSNFLDPVPMSPREGVPILPPRFR